jgi:hypothetical protein
MLSIAFSLRFFMTMPSLSFADSLLPAIKVREQAVPQGMAVRCQLAALPNNERTATFPLRNIRLLPNVCVHKEINTMPKLLTIFALLTGLTGLSIAPSSAFAQVCNPALAAGFLYQCPPEAEGLFDHRDFRHFRDDNGFHDNHGFHGDGGEHNFGRGVGHGGGMGHGGGAGHGR